MGNIPKEVHVKIHELLHQLLSIMQMAGEKTVSIMQIFSHNYDAKIKVLIEA